MLVKEYLPVGIGGGLVNDVGSPEACKIVEVLGLTHQIIQWGSVVGTGCFGIRGAGVAASGKRIDEGSARLRRNGVSGWKLLSSRCGGECGIIAASIFRKLIIESRMLVPAIDIIR